MTLNDPHPMLVVAWVVSRTRGHSYGWELDKLIAQHFHAPIRVIRTACNLGVEVGLLRRKTIGSHVAYGFEPDEEASFWREMDFLDRYGLLKDASGPADESTGS